MKYISCIAGPAITFLESSTNEAPRVMSNVILSWTHRGTGTPEDPHYRAIILSTLDGFAICEINPYTAIGNDEDAS